MVSFFKTIVFFVVITVCIIVSLSIYARPGRIGFKFDKGKASKGYIKITPETIFNDHTGKSEKWHS